MSRPTRIEYEDRAKAVMPAISMAEIAATIAKRYKTDTTKTGDLKRKSAG